MIGLYNVLKKKMKSTVFFDAYLQIKLTTVYFFSKLYVKLAVIRKRFKIRYHKSRVVLFFLLS